MAAFPTPNPWGNGSGEVPTAIPTVHYSFGDSTNPFNTQPYPLNPFTNWRLSTYSQPGYRLLKLASRPAMREVYGYREEWSPTEHMVVRVFDVPWSGRKACVDWWLGYTTTKTVPGPEVGEPISRNCTVTAGSNFVTVLSGTQGLTEGMLITGDGIPPNTTILSIDSSTQITIGTTATSSGASVSLSFSPLGGDPGTPTTLYRISRVLPDQVPKYPHLYAIDAKLIEPRELAITQDPMMAFPDQFKDGELVLRAGYAPMPYYASKFDGDLFEGIARYAVTYRQLPYELLTDDELIENPSGGGATAAGELGRYVDRQISYAVQAQPIPTGIVFNFTEGPYKGRPIIGNPQFIMPTKQIIYRWVDVPDINDEAINACVGRVNQDTFDGSFGWPRYDPQTLLCHAPQTKRYRDRNGRVLWEIIYRFDYRESTWNKFLATNRQYYRAALAGLPSQPLYDTADFNKLFTIPQTA